ncbi:MAG: PilZ domain-containing protein [Deltaproteobacteria bacterium]|nr:PilZ domain-containing protein [Deltaproteobacteria bacterium]
MVTKERRSDVRGDFPFQIKYKIMKVEEFEDLKRFDKEIFSSTNKAQSVDIIASEISTESTANAALMNYILQVDEKLDQILALLSKDGSVAVPFRPGLGLNISGSGMQIVIEQPVESGQIINAKFFLSKLPIVFMDIFGKVIRVDQEDEDSRVLYKAGIKFLVLNISDRERIIASVFQKQREDLRKRKNILFTNSSI